MSLWEGIEVYPGGLKFSHLQYADDTIIFCPPNLSYLQNIKKSLILFQLASGLQVNFFKSSIMGINVTDNWLECAAKSLLCKKDTIPFKYLGLPIGCSSSRIATWDPIISKIEKKLASWQGKMLSIGGRLTLIKSSLSNLPLYFMSLYPIPQGVISKITAIQRRFLWSGNMEKKAMPLMRLEIIQLPRKLGGLAVGNLYHRNLALLFKWLWRFFSEKESLWKSVIQCKYKYSNLLEITELQIPKSGGPWRNICASILNNLEAKKLALTGIRKKIENGRSSFFWHDQWVGDSPLKTVFPRLYAISAQQNATIESTGLWNGLKWIWALV